MKRLPIALAGALSLASTAHAFGPGSIWYVAHLGPEVCVPLDHLAAVDMVTPQLRVVKDRNPYWDWRDPWSLVTWLAAKVPGIPSAPRTPPGNDGSAIDYDLRTVGGVVTLHFFDNIPECQRFIASEQR